MRHPFLCPQKFPCPLCWRIASFYPEELILGSDGASRVNNYASQATADKKVAEISPAQ